MSDKNMSIQQRYEHEFNNSTDVGQSLWRLVKEPPEAVVRRLVAKFIGLIVSIMDSILETLGISLTEPDKLWENVDKATEKTKLLSLVMVRVLEDPEVKENLKQVALALNDSAIKPFFAIALITLKEMQPAIDEAEAEFTKRLAEAIRRAGDGAWDAFENVIAGVPGVGNAWSAFSALTSVIQAGQTVIQTNLQLILESTYRILATLRKLNVPGLESIDNFIDFGLNAYNVYTNVQNKFDQINATLQQSKFEPTPLYDKAKIVKDLKEQNNAAQELMPQSIKDVEKDMQESGKKTEDEKEDTKLVNDDKSDVKPQDKSKKNKSKKRGGFRKKRKNRTKKRALKKYH